MTTPGGSLDRERNSGRAEEMETASVPPTEDGAVETQGDVTLEGTDDCFQDPTAISKTLQLCVDTHTGNGHRVHYFLLFSLY